MNRELGIEHTLEEGDKLLQLASNPKQDRTFAAMVKQPLFPLMMNLVKERHAKLQDGKKKVDKIWGSMQVTPQRSVELQDLNTNINEVRCKQIIGLLVQSKFLQ